MSALLTRIVFSLLAGGCLSSIAWADISKNADQVTYDFFYYQEPLLDLVNDVRRLSNKNILFRPADLKGVSVSYGREKVELMTAFTEVVGIYGFGFKRMADNIWMIERIRSVEEVEASLNRGQNVESEEDAASERLTDSKTVTSIGAPTFKVSEISNSIPAAQSKGIEGEGADSQSPRETRLKSPEFVRAVAGFQRRYIEALLVEGFSKEEALKMATAFNPVSLVPSEETLPKP